MLRFEPNDGPWKGFKVSRHNHHLGNILCGEFSGYYFSVRTVLPGESFTHIALMPSEMHAIADRLDELNGEGKS